MNTKEMIFVHTTSADFNKIKHQFIPVNNWHKERWGKYFNTKTGEWVLPSSMGYYGGYTILIDPDGREYRYRTDNEETVAVKGYNNKSLSVALAFDGDIQLPTPAQVTTLEKRLKKWVQKYNIPIENIKHHRDVNPHKTCPGLLIPDNWARDLVKRKTESKLNIEKQKQLLSFLQLLVVQLKILLSKLK